MHKISGNTQSLFSRLPSPTWLAQTLFSTLYKTGNYLVQSLKNPRVIIPFGTVLIAYQIYQRIVKKEAVEQVYPDQALVSEYAAQIQSYLTQNGEISLVTKAHVQLTQSYPNSSLNAQNVIELLHLPEHIEKFRLNALGCSFDPLTKEIALQLMSRQLIPEYAKAIQNCLNNPSDENLKKIHEFFSLYPTEIAKQVRTQSIIDLMDAAQCPTLATFETLAQKINPQSPARAVIDHMHRHRLFEDYCTMLQKFFDQETNLTMPSKKEDSPKSESISDEPITLQSLKALKQKWDEKFSQHRIEPDKVIKKLSKGPLGLPTLQELKAIGIPPGAVDSLTKQVIEKLLKQRQEEQDIQAFVQAVTAFLCEQNNDEAINKAAAQLPQHAKIPFINLGHIPFNVQATDFTLPQNDLARALVKVAIRDKKAAILQKNYEKAFEAFLKDPTAENANIANGILSQLQALTGQRRLSLTDIDSKLLPSAEKLMKMRDIAHGNERQIVLQLLIRQTKNELLDAAIKGNKDEHPFLVEINTKLAEEEKKKKYQDFSQNSFASSLSFSKGSHVKWRPEYDELVELQKEFGVRKENIQQGLILSKEATETLIIRYAQARIANSPSIAYEIAILIQINKNNPFLSSSRNPIDHLCTPEEFPLEKLSNLGSSYFNDPIFEENVARPLQELRRDRLWKHIVYPKENHHELMPIAHLAVGNERQFQRALQDANLVTLALAHQMAQRNRQQQLMEKIDKLLSLYPSLHEAKALFESLEAKMSREGGAYHQALLRTYNFLCSHVQTKMQ